MHSVSASVFARAGAALRTRVQRPTVASLKHAVKTGLAAGLAVWFAQLAGLEDPYWAGISAAVVANPHIGGSVGAAMSRIGATVAGLALGLAAVTLVGRGVVLGAVVVALAVMVLPAVGISTGVRLGAATTLILTVYPAGDELLVALSRGVNIPLGSAVAVLVGVVLWPARASRNLTARLRADVGSVGVLAHDALSGYARIGDIDRLDGQVRAIQRVPAAHVALLRDAVREPGARPRLERETIVAARLVDEAVGLARTASEGAGDAAAELLAAELLDVAETIEEATRVYADHGAERTFDDAVARAEHATATLRSALDQLRARHGTLAYASDELLRLLSTIQAAQALVGQLAGLRHAAR